MTAAAKIVRPCCANCRHWVRGYRPAIDGEALLTTNIEHQGFCDQTNANGNATAVKGQHATGGGGLETNETAYCQWFERDR